MLYFRLAQRFSQHFFAIVSGESMSAGQIMGLEPFERAVYILAIIKLGATYDSRTNMVYSTPDVMLADAHPMLDAAQREQVYGELYARELAARMHDGVHLPPNDEVSKVMSAIMTYHEGGEVLIGITRWVKPKNGECNICLATVSGDDTRCRRCASLLPYP